MLKLLGAVIVLSACVLYGNLLTKKEEEGVLIAEALCSFVIYLSTSIKTARSPLKSIFESFGNTDLERCGFIDALRRDGLPCAVNSIENIISKDTYDTLIYLENNIGGIDVESQLKMCSYVEVKLREEFIKAKNTFESKKRIYGTLPVLAGLSLIILIV